MCFKQSQVPPESRMFKRIAAFFMPKAVSGKLALFGGTLGNDTPGSKKDTPEGRDYEQADRDGD
jgi:hypothetical protein